MTGWPMPIRSPLHVPSPVSPRRKMPDLILSGTQSSDHAHGSTGTALARILGMPHGSVIASVAWDGQGDITVTRELEGGTRHVQTMPAPAVLAIQTGTNVPRYATMRMIKQAKKKPLEVVDGSALIDGGGGYRVRRMYTPSSGKGADAGRHCRGSRRTDRGPDPRQERRLNHAGNSGCCRTA